MPGPAPKDPQKRQRRDTPQVELVPDQLAIVPKAPTGLLKKSKERWQVFWESPVSKMVDMNSDMPALERLFFLYDERLRASRGFRRQRMVEGSQGQLVVNPLAKLFKDFDAEIRQLEDRFGLTPMARMRLGFTFGEAAGSLTNLNKLLEEDFND
jgi:P27 family predicted phage terminase small subunit|tara:strand:- start:25021 stop:25482 length:462 start_codon:yes stop_codon:yes gene_type:complete